MKEAFGSWKPKRQKCGTNPSLPHEIIENMILSRLPVKDLLRFRVVCKQWKATISDPTFAQIHFLQFNKNPSSRNLFAWEKPCVNFNFVLHVAELRNNCIEFVSAIELIRGSDFYTMRWCSCDGLYLICLIPSTNKEADIGHHKLVLWNPSCRMYRELNCPPSVDVPWSDSSVHGMYYDPLMKNYKIVMGDMEHYVVYSYRDNKWGDVKEMKGYLGYRCYHSGSGPRDFFVNGSIYWVVTKHVDQLDISEVIYFDCKDESFKRLPLPNLKPLDAYRLKLSWLGGQLCLLITYYTDEGRIEIMKKVSSGDEWMESKEECLCEYRSNFPFLNQVSENEILVQDRGKSMVYDKRKNTLVKIHDNYLPLRNYDIPLISHFENLFLL